MFVANKCNGGLTQLKCGMPNFTDSTDRLLQSTTEHGRLRLKVLYVSQYLAAYSTDCLHGPLPGPFRLSYSVFDCIFPLIFRFWAVR